MSDDFHDEYQAAIADERAEAAREWDEMSFEDNPRNVIGADGDWEEILADLGDEYQVDPDIGPIQFQGKEDYIRGGTACLRGCDIVGTVTQKGSILGARMVMQNRGAGFVQQTTGDGKSFTTLRVGQGGTTGVTKRIDKSIIKNLRKITPDMLAKAVDYKTIAERARMAAKHGQMVAKTLTNFKSSTPGKAPVKPSRKAIVGSLRAILPPPSKTKTTATNRSSSVVSRPGGATRVLKIKAPKYTKKPVPSDAVIRDLAKKLAKSSSKLGTTATKYESAAKSADIKHTAGIAAAQKTYGPGGTRGVRVIGGDDHNFVRGLEELGSATEILGEVMELVGGTPDPGHPGYNTDRTPIATQPGDQPDGNGFMQPSGAFDPDPKWGPTPSYDESKQFAQQGGGNTQTGDTTDFFANLPPGPDDDNYGMGQPPTLESDGVAMVEGLDYIKGPDPASVYDNDFCKGDPANMPLGCIVFDKRMAFPRSGVGSKTRFLGGAPGDFGGGDSGFEFGNQTDNGHDDGWYWFYANAYNVGVSDLRYKHDDRGNWVTPPYYNYDGAAHKEGNFPKPLSPAFPQYDPAVDPGRARAEASLACGWGPLMGNPNKQGDTCVSPNDPGMQQRAVPVWVWGLNYDITTDTWFWFYDQAPQFMKDTVLAQRLQAAAVEWAANLEARKAEYLQAVATAKKHKAEADEQARQWALQQAQIQHDIDNQKQKDDAAQASADAAAARSDQAFQQQQEQASASLAQKQAEADLAYQTQQDQLDAQQQQMEMQAYQSWLQSPQAQDGGGDAVDQGAYPSDFDDLPEQMPAQVDSVPPGSPFADINNEPEGNEFGEVVPMDASEKELAMNADRQTR